MDTTSEIEPNLFRGTADALYKAVDKGLGIVDMPHPDADMALELKNSAGLFAAFKSHRQQNDLAKAMLQPDGTLKSFADFKKDTAAITAAYNQDWLATEYNTAVLRSRQAANFRKFERDADLYPNLEWLRSTSLDKREGHRPFYGKVWPIKDPHWDSHYPGSLWNCKCGITNTRAKPTGDISTDDLPEPVPGLDKNPATGELFTASHPYRTKAYPGAEQAAARAARKEQNKLLDEVIKKHAVLIDQAAGKKIRSPEAVSGSFTILRSSLSEVRQHTRDMAVATYLLNDVEPKINQWRYVGWSNVMPGKHKESAYFLYYTTEIGGKQRYVNVKAHRHIKSEVVYAILDSINLDFVKEGIPEDLFEFISKEK